MRAAAWALIGLGFFEIACHAATALPLRPPAPTAEARAPAEPALRLVAAARPTPRPASIRTPAPATASEPTCPREMALIPGARGSYCIDRWEASLVRVAPDGTATPYPFNHVVDGVESELRAVSQKGALPQGYISGFQAALACRNADKRLCEVDEWRAACRGPNGTRYPYGNVRRAHVCNDRFAALDHHPVASLWRRNPVDRANPQGMWQSQFMNDPRLLELDHTATPTGSFPECSNDYGVYDMVGNLHEWVSDPHGTFLGGFFMDTYRNGEGCEYQTRAHDFDYHDYSTGFRCCADPRGGGRD